VHLNILSWPNKTHHLLHMFRSDKSLYHNLKDVLIVTYKLIFQVKQNMILQYRLRRTYTDFELGLEAGFKFGFKFVELAFKFINNI
jgi:hypothetical protein